jgi:peptide/nickel transport system permease protein
MLRFLIHKIPSVLLVTVLSSMVAFLLPRLAPGDPTDVLTEGNASPQLIAAMRTQMGLNKPLWRQYADWVGALLHGDLGTSFVYRHPVAELIGSRLESTVELTISATILMVVIGLGLGVLGGSRLGRWSRAAVDAFDTVFLSMPPFLTGLIMILLLGILFRVLPVSGEVPFTRNPNFSVQYLVMPSLALALPSAAVIARLVQTSMLANRGEDYVDLAVAKGVPPRRITWRHVTRNSLGTAVVVIGLRVGELLGGAIVIENVFARNGLGSLAVNAVQNRDYLLVQVLVLGAVLVAVIVQLLSEIAMAALDPRIRLGSS